MKATIFLLLFAAGVALADRDATPSLADSQRLRATWTIDNWDDGGPLTRYVFLNMTEFWTHSLIDRDGPVRPLDVELRKDVAEFRTETSAGEMSLSDYADTPTVDALLVLHEGRIVFEAYPGMRQHDKHNYMSVSKVFVSTLVGQLVDRGLIDEEQPIDQYLPELGNSGYSGVPVIDILDMASGVDCRELIEGAYDDPATCHYGLEASLGMLRPTNRFEGDVYEYLATVEGRRPHGEAFEYGTVNTAVLGWLIERIAGLPYSAVLERDIWQRSGAESDAVMLAPRRAVPAVGAGISSTLRDLGRFGLLFTPAARRAGNPVVSDRLLAQIQTGGRPALYREGRPDTRINGEPPLANSYQWDWVMEDGDFFKSGFGGQGLYVSPSRNLVIAFFGTHDLQGDENELDQVARQLATSGLFQ